MSWLTFQTYPLLLNLAISVMAAVLIWIAGSRISGDADRIADRTGLDKAFLGLVFLALATETPEIGTTVTAAWGATLLWRWATSLAVLSCRRPFWSWWM